MKEREALTLARKTLALCNDHPWRSQAIAELDKLIEQKSNALAQPEQEQSGFFSREAMRAHSDFHVAQPEQENQREAEVIDRIVAEHGYPKEFQYFAAALKANKPNNDDMLQEIARLHDRIKDLEADVEFLSRPPQPKEPEQEPVAWIDASSFVMMHQDPRFDRVQWQTTLTLSKVYEGQMPLYTTSPQRKLTDEEFLELLLRKGNAEVVGYCTFVYGSIPMRGRTGLLRSAKIIKEFIEDIYGIKE